MKILAGSTGGAGHLGPMMPFLRGAAAAGADVLLAAPEGMRTDAVPFTALPDTPPHVLGAIFGALESMPSREAANAHVIGGVFGRANVDATLPEWERLVAEWRPDLVVREVGEFGSYVASSRAGVPQVQVGLGLHAMHERFYDVLDGSGFSDRYGVPVEPLRTARTLSLVPASLDAPGAPVERYRDPAMAPAADATASAAGEPPLVYVTFGSVTAGMPQFAGVYRAALDALADVPVRVLMTVGRAGDPESLAPVPPNAQVVTWADQAAVLREASVAVGHGGFGTTFGALAAGVPPVVLPLFSSDQFDNASAVAASGVGLAVQDASELPRAVTHALFDPTIRERVRAVADEMAALPDAATWWAP